ncbi:Pao retrotransposon peptidase family protein [Dirofilaria immitis]|nr:Pao retrotransposon peptidase family protein [Dirofilaria immitis]
MVQFKLFLQHLWKTNYTLDQSISEEDEETWECLIKEWSTDIKDLPRCVIHPSEQMQLHVFTDASSLAYSAAIYVRNYGIEGVKTSLIFAKSRIAPIKGITIPRLELLAIIVGVRAVHFVINQLNLEKYSYGWLGVRCQSTTNFIFIKDEIFLYDGKGLLSDFDNVERCTAISGKCVTNNGIVLWDEEMGKSCPYRKIDEFDAQLSGSHVIIDKLQTSFIFKENGIILNSNCNFSEPYLMNGDIIIDKGTNNLANNIRKQRSDPEDFKAGIVSKFEIEKINADFEILAQTLGITNPVHGPTREESLRELIVEQGEELVNQLETEFDETTELIEQELSENLKSKGRQFYGTCTGSYTQKRDQEPPNTIQYFPIVLSLNSPSSRFLGNVGKPRGN